MDKRLFIGDKCLWEILVPCTWNDKKPVRKRHHKEWDKRIRALSGGLTVLSPGKGIWDNGGVIYEDRYIPVRIFCDAETIEKIADITIKHYEQLAVMFYKVSDAVVIKNASDKQRAAFIREDLNAFS